MYPYFNISFLTVVVLVLFLTLIGRILTKTRLQESFMLMATVEGYTKKKEKNKGSSLYCIKVGIFYLLSLEQLQKDLAQ